MGQPGEPEAFLEEVVSNMTEEQVEESTKPQVQQGVDKARWLQVLSHL